MSIPDEKATLSIGITGWPFDIVGWLFNVSETRNGFWEGRAIKTCTFAALFYLIVTFGALAVYALNDTKAKDLHCWQLLLAIGVGIIVSAGPPAFFWAEAKAFDRWLNKKIPDVEKQKSWRETYKLNVDHGKVFWAAMLAVYGAILYIKS